jgi:hypothetical protein
VCPKSLDPKRILFVAYTIWSIRSLAQSTQLYYVYAGYAQHIMMDSSTTVHNSVSKAAKISDFNSIHPCAFWSNQRM